MHLYKNKNFGTLLGAIQWNGSNLNEIAKITGKVAHKDKSSSRLTLVDPTNGSVLVTVRIGQYLALSAQGFVQIEADTLYTHFVLE